MSYINECITGTSQLLLAVNVKMKVVAVFTLCAILAGIASAKPVPEDSTIVQLVNKMLSELQSKQQQDAEEQSLLTRLSDMAILQDALEDEVKNQHAVKEQIGGGPFIHFPTCICVTEPCPCDNKKAKGIGPPTEY